MSRSHHKKNSKGNRKKSQDQSDEFRIKDRDSFQKRYKEIQDILIANGYQLSVPHSMAVKDSDLGKLITYWKEREDHPIKGENIWLNFNINKNEECSFFIDVPFPRKFGIQKLKKARKIFKRTFQFSDEVLGKCGFEWNDACNTEVANFRIRKFTDIENMTNSCIMQQVKELEMISRDLKQQIYLDLEKLLLKRWMTLLTQTHLFLFNHNPPSDTIARDNYGNPVYDCKGMCGNETSDMLCVTGPHQIEIDDDGCPCIDFECNGLPFRFIDEDRFDNLTVRTHVSVPVQHRFLQMENGSYHGLNHKQKAFLNSIKKIIVKSKAIPVQIGDLRGFLKGFDLEFRDIDPSQIDDVWEKCVSLSEMIKNCDDLFFRKELDSEKGDSIAYA